jgi:hypothetical protein
VLTPVAEFVVAFTLLVEFTVVLTGAGSWHWHLLLGITLVETTLLQSVHEQLVTLEVELAPRVTLHVQD